MLKDCRSSWTEDLKKNSEYKIIRIDYFLEKLMIKLIPNNPAL